MTFSGHDDMINIVLGLLLLLLLTHSLHIRISP